MQPARVAGYLQHRLATAAAGPDTPLDVFTARAAKCIADYSGGVPRLINIVANKCLMLAYGEDVHSVTPAHVHLAARDTPGIVPRRAWWQKSWNIGWPARRKEIV
jgi:MSHA biogenesis protein MshM